MFTGIVQTLGRVADVVVTGDDRTLVVDIAELNAENIGTGDSVAVNGACLTVTRREDRLVWFDVSAETLSRTRLGDMCMGDPVNLEPALRADTRLGGHFVTGHVDAVGTLFSTVADARSVSMIFVVPATLGRFIAEKGSVTVDGVSLTVNRVRDTGPHVEFDVNIVPHTQKTTTLGALREGAEVHLEVDLLARYLDRLQIGCGNSSKIGQS